MTDKNDNSSYQELINSVKESQEKLKINSKEFSNDIKRLKKINNARMIFDITFFIVSISILAVTIITIINMDIHW